MPDVAVDLLALADAVLARRSRIHAPKGSEHVNTPTAITTPLAEDFAERAALAEVGAGVPREWAEGYARLQVARPPAGIANWRWQQVIDDAGRFLDRWAGHAAALGWRTLDVFGVHDEMPAERFDAAGLVWCVRGAEIIVITGKTARLKTASGAVQTFARHDPKHPEAVAIWGRSEVQSEK